MLKFKEWLKNRDELNAAKHTSGKGEAKQENAPKIVNNNHGIKSVDIAKPISDERMNVIRKTTMKKLRESLGDYLYKDHMSAAKGK